MAAVGTVQILRTRRQLAELAAHTIRQNPAGEGADLKKRLPFMTQLLTARINLMIQDQAIAKQLLDKIDLGLLISECLLEAGYPVE